jgi:hypothetical protein
MKLTLISLLIPACFLRAKPDFTNTSRHHQIFFFHGHHRILHSSIWHSNVGYSKIFLNDPVCVLDSSANGDQALIVNHDGVQSGLNFKHDRAIVQIGFHLQVVLRFHSIAMAIFRKERNVGHLLTIKNIIVKILYSAIIRFTIFDKKLYIQLNSVIAITVITNSWLCN